MLHSSGARFHAGTVVCLSEVQHEAYTDELAEIQRYNVDRRKWLVRLRHPRFKGKQILVNESGFNILYCVLPHNVTADGIRQHVPVARQEHSLSGRCLAIAGACLSGHPIFEEAPFFLSTSGVEAMWHARWHAYVAMYEGSRADAAMGSALSAFEELTCGSEKKALDFGVKDAAEEVARMSGYHETLGDAPAVRDVVEKITGALLKVKANQCEFDDGSRFQAGALYRQISLLNHSCCPTVVLEPQWSTLDAGATSPSDGWVVVRAEHDLRPGDALCFNYGPVEILSWPYTRRQEYILDELGFSCVCLRCAGECAGAAREKETNAAMVCQGDTLTELSCMD